MKASDPGFTPLGRLHDPLISLSARIQRALTTHRMTVWCDDRGSVFANHAFLVRSMTPSLVVGTYDQRTPQCIIERDLRVALRRRASQWIVDWDVPIPVQTAEDRRRSLAKSCLRPRRRRSLAMLEA
jgi:hypothetical protein